MLFQPRRSYQVDTQFIRSRVKLLLTVFDMRHLFHIGRCLGQKRNKKIPAGETRKNIFWPNPDVEEGSFDSTGFSAERTSMSVSEIPPQWWVFICLCFQSSAKGVYTRAVIWDDIQRAKRILSHTTFQFYVLFCFLLLLLLLFVHKTPLLKPN